MTDYQKNECRENIKTFISDYELSKADHDKLRRLFKGSGTSVKELTIYLGLNVLLSSAGNEVDSEFISYLPKGIGEYSKPDFPHGLYLGGYQVLESELPGRAKPSPKKLYSFHLDRDVKSQLEARAKAEERTVSGVIRMAIKRYLESS